MSQALSAERASGLTPGPRAASSPGRPRPCPAAAFPRGRPPAPPTWPTPWRRKTGPASATDSSRRRYASPRATIGWLPERLPRPLPSQPHLASEFDAKSAEQALATMTADPHVNLVPLMIGARGRAELRDFYANHFLNQIPPDTEMVPVSRTIRAGGL